MAKVDRDVAIEKALYWDVNYEAQMENINHLVFILDLYMDKLLIDLVAKINSMIGEIGVVVKPANCRALKMTPLGALLPL